MISILKNNFDKWSIGKECALLITSPFYGVGVSFLSKKLSIQYKAKLIQIDTLGNFLRLNEFHFIEAKGMNIDELEDKLLNDSNFRLTSDADSFNQKDSVLNCIQFIKETQPDIYNKLKDVQFGNKYYTVGAAEYHKYPYDSLIYDEYIDYLLKKYRYENELVIIESALLLKKLSEDKELIKNAPIIIVDSDNKFTLYLNHIKGIKNQVENYNPQINSIKEYCSILWSMFKQRNRANDIFNRGKLYQSYIKNSTNLYTPNNPNIINNLKYSTDYDF